VAVDDANGNVADVNECTEYDDVCGAGGERCQNTPGSFSCLCLDGYEFNGDTCIGTTALYSRSYRIHMQAAKCHCQCRIKVGATGAAAPGPALLGAAIF